MERVSQGPDHDLWLRTLDRPFAFRSPFSGEDFVVMLVVNDASITDEERDAVCFELVRQGCRYAVCAGDRCSAWDDAIDVAYLMTAPDFAPPPDRFIMTTWHEHESIKEVACFFRWCTAFEGFVPKNFLVLLLGPDAGGEAEIRRALAEAPSRSDPGVSGLPSFE